MMSKKRQSARCRTSDYYTITDQRSNQIIGRTANISMGGMMLITDTRLEKGGVYNFRLNLPESAECGPGFAFDGECRWSQYNDLAGWWENGIQMKNLSDEAQATLKKLANESLVEESD
jgi:hypothetical protein